MKLNFIIFAIFFPFFANANIQLTDTLKCDGNPATKTKEQLQAGSEVFKILYSNGVENISSCLGWTNFGEGDDWYIADKKNGIHSVNIKNKKYLGSWKIGVTDPCEDAETPDCETPWWSGRWGNEEFLEPEVRRLFIGFGGNVFTGVGKTIGCFNDNPLRYGDIENDGTKELVLIINHNWIIFNTELKKVTFSNLLNVNDWLTAQETAELFGDQNGPDRPQYVSLNEDQAAYSGKIDSLINTPALRGYGKLYVGSFTEGGAKEILIWRKLYRSKLNKDPIKGFEKVSDSFAHYKLIDGEYKLQTTAQGTIKGWLTAKNLTWQKGYPSKSECPGQEGQLIPEMHDPLLNDPDVLQ